MWQDHTHPITTPTRMRSKRTEIAPRVAVMLLSALWFVELLSSPSLVTMGVAEPCLRVVGDSEPPVMVVNGSSGVLPLAVGIL